MIMCHVRQRLRPSDHPLRMSMMLRVTASPLCVRTSRNWSRERHYLFNEPCELDMWAVSSSFRGIHCHGTSTCVVETCLWPTASHSAFLSSSRPCPPSPARTAKAQRATLRMSQKYIIKKEKVRGCRASPCASPRCNLVCIASDCTQFRAILEGIVRTRHPPT